MSGDVHPRNLLLQRQPLPQGIIRQIRQRVILLNQRRTAERHVEQADLPVYRLLAQGRVRIHGGFKHRHQLRTIAAHAVERARLDEALDDALVAFARVDAAAEVEDVAVRAVLALADDRVHSALPDRLDRAQAEENPQLSVRGFRDGEFPLRTVHVRRQNRNAARTAVLDVCRDFRRIAVYAVENRRHKRHGMIALEPRRLDADNGIRGGMGFVEGVGRERGHLVVKV